MDDLDAVLNGIVKAQKAANKPLAIVLAGHNGSGKSTFWYERLAQALKIPLVNADRMMLSILPEGAKLPDWAVSIRDTDQSWQRVAQQGVYAFVAQAMVGKVAFAMETVFSHWKTSRGKPPESKVDLIREMQAAGYFVLLIFVGLANTQLSIARVATRVARGGHAVPEDRLVQRFPRTQRAIAYALPVVDAAILVDNSREPEFAFTLCHVQQGQTVTYDCRNAPVPPPASTLAWMDIVVPTPAPASSKTKKVAAKAPASRRKPPRTR